MSDQYKPIEDLDGIGRVYGQKLRALKVDLIRDMIWYAPSVLHRLSAIPLKDLYRYRSTALLLEVRNMTLTSAEVLAAADIFSSAELQTKNTTEVMELLKKGKVRMKENLVADMIADARLLHYTGTLTGRVVDKRGRSMKEVSVSCGPFSTKTDTYGRFRFYKLPAANTYPVQLAMEGKEPMVVDHLQVYAQKQIPDLQTITYTPLKLKVSKGDEYDGDTMPSLFKPSYKIITRTDALRVFDYLSVFEVKEGMVTLVSRYKAWDDQTVFIHQWKVEAPHFPADTPKGTIVRILASGELVPARFSSSHRKLNSALQQTREAFANRAKPTTPMELEAYMREYSETIGQHFNNKRS